MSTVVAIWTIYGALMGAGLASFGCLVAERVPSGVPLHHRSRCRCRRALTVAELLPVAGWLACRGRARCCGAVIPTVYVVAEAAAGVLGGSTAGLGTYLVVRGLVVSGAVVAFAGLLACLGLALALGRASTARVSVRDERGSSALEFVILTPVLILFLLFVVGMGRLGHAKQQIESVAADSARAASLERNTSLSASVASSAAQQSLGQAGVACTGLRVLPDLSDYRPGGRVTVTVECTADLGDVALVGFPGSKTFTATSSVPIENYRGN